MGLMCSLGASLLVWSDYLCLCGCRYVCGLCDVVVVECVGFGVGCL